MAPLASRIVALQLALLIAALAVSGAALGQEKDAAGWALFLDNDALGGTHDHDYTGGIALTLAGARVRRWPLSLDGTLGWVDRQLGLERAEATQWHAMQFSLLTFTPRNLDRPEVIPGDRPYASIAYVANSRTTVLPDSQTAWQSTLALGVLGLDAAKATQRVMHEALAVDEPQGWGHQISEGGEPTARYSLARLGLRGVHGTGGGTRIEIKDAVAASAGYITEANVALTARWGRIHTPWWSFVPERAEYMIEPAPVFGGGATDGPREFYAWAGVKARARAYNALLQGQFRDSDLTYDFEDTRPLIGEAWAGVTKELPGGYRLSWVLRYQSSELRTAPGDRDLLWGGVSVSRSF